MSTFLYNNARHLFATGQLSWTGSAVNAMLVEASYGALRTDVHVSDIPSGAIISRDIALTSLAEANGVCSGSIPTQSAFLSAYTVAALVLYVKGASDAVSPLIYYSSDGLGFPFLPSGFDYAIGYDLSSGGWFQL